MAYFWELVDLKDKSEKNKKDRETILTAIYYSLKIDGKRTLAEIDKIENKNRLEEFISNNSDESV